MCGEGIVEDAFGRVDDEDVHDTSVPVSLHLYSQYVWTESDEEVPPALRQSNIFPGIMFDCRRRWTTAGSSLSLS